jgi:hypothetical protein
MFASLIPPQVENEPPLVFARQLTMDGNNSLKRWRKAGSEWDVAFRSRYILTRAEVNVCENEVSSRATRRDDHDSGAPATKQSLCSERWRNARPENERASAWDVLDETGIFVCLCRHGFVFFITDMWESGEL